MNCLCGCDEQVRAWTYADFKAFVVIALFRAGTLWHML